MKNEERPNTLKNVHKLKNTTHKFKQQIGINSVHFYVLLQRFLSVP